MAFIAPIFKDVIAFSPREPKDIAEILIIDFGWYGFSLLCDCPIIFLHGIKWLVLFLFWIAGKVECLIIGYPISYNCSVVPNPNVFFTNGTSNEDDATIKLVNPPINANPDESTLNLWKKNVSFKPCL